MLGIRISDLSSLKRRLAVLYAATAVVIIAGGLMYRLSYRAALRHDSEKLLLSIESFKLDQLNYWRSDTIADTLSLLENPGYSSALKRFAADISDPGLAAALSKQLRRYIDTYKYQAAVLTDGEGRILLTAGDGLRTLTPETRRIMTLSGAEGRPEIGEFDLTPGERKPHLTLAAQAAGAHGGKKLFLVVRIPPQDYLLPLIQKWPAATNTGETLIARKEGGDIVFLSEPRLGPGISRIRLSPATAALPSALAINGLAGIVRSRDYRGVQVLAAVSPVPGTSWVMVTKMDWDEVMADSGRVSALLILLTLALLAAAGAGAFLLFRLQAEEYLRSYKELDRQVSKIKTNYDIFTASANDGILVSDPDTLRIKEVNKKFCEMYGYTAGEALTLKITALVQETMVDAQKARLDYSRANMGAVLEAVHKRKNGELFPVELSSSFVAIENENYIFTIIRDISGRRKTEEALQTSEHQLSSIYKNISSIIFYLAVEPDDHFRFISVNPAFLEVTGLKEDQVAGKLFEEVIPVTARDLVLEKYKEAVRTRKTVAWEEVSEYPAGKKYGEIRLTPITDSDGNCTKLIGVVHDVTERKAAEAALEKLNRDLTDTKQEMENFLYITTHDLRSPLVNIQGFSQNLERHMAELRETLAPAVLPPEIRAKLDDLAGNKIPGALGFVLQSSRKMDALITALLKISRLGRVEIKPETVDMNGLLSRIQDSMRYQIEASGGKVKVADLPPCLADQDAMGKLFTNLLDNAVRYRHSARPLEVNVTGEVRGAMVLYKVTDNGSGIPAPELDRLWIVFYDPERPPGKQGEGIGLPLVRRLTEKNGGTIRAESKEGEGSIFYVELPAAEEDKKWRTMKTA